MFGKMGDLMNLVKNASQIQERMKAMQEELQRRTHEADAGGGAVTVRVNGRGEVLAVQIRMESVPSGDAELLEEFVKSAVNAALRKNQEAIQAEMAGLAAGMNLPALGNMLGVPPPGD